MDEKKKYVAVLIFEPGSAFADDSCLGAGNSAADVVENQTMTIGGKEQIVTKAALEKAQKAQKAKEKIKAD